MPEMRWIHELVWLALAVIVVTVLTLLIVSLIIGANAGGMG